MQKGKAPSPNDFSVKFFRTFWDILVKYLTLAVEEVRARDRILKALNHTFLILIPKEGDMKSLSNYRPIALCSVVYKIIS